MSKLKTLNAADYEDELDPIDKLILKCLREHLADYYQEGGRRVVDQQDS